MNNKYNKSIYKEDFNKYKQAKSYDSIAKQIKHEREKKELKQILEYINSLNRTDTNQLLNIFRNIANIAPTKNIQPYINSLPTSQIINLLNFAISQQRQLKAQASTSQSSLSSQQPTPTQPTAQQKKQGATQSSTTQQTAQQSKVSQSQTTTSSQQQKTKNPIIRIFTILKNKFSFQKGQPQSQQPSQNLPKPTSTIFSQKNPWSPISNAGKIYRFNRGVIGIDKNGQKYEIILDRTNRHHNDATAEIGLKTDCYILNRSAGPFQIATDVANQGTIIIQLEGDSMLVYLPDTLTVQQQKTLSDEMSPRSNFELSFTHKGDLYSNVNTDDLAIICQNIIKNTHAMQPTK